MNVCITRGEGGRPKRTVGAVGLTGAQPCRAPPAGAVPRRCPLWAASSGSYMQYGYACSVELETPVSPRDTPSPPGALGGVWDSNISYLILKVK